MFGVRRMGGLRKLGRSTMKAPYRVRPTVGCITCADLNV
jgi:hypothetical protein